MADYYPPSSRFGDYDPNVIQGIVGGIPDRSGGNIIDPTDFGFDEGETGANNVTALNDAVAAAVNGDVVLLPAGEFDITSWGVTLTTANMEITVRGAGMNDTTLHCSGATGIGVEISTDYGNAFNPIGVITAMSAGSNVITLADASSFPIPSGPGDYRIGRIQLVNEVTTPICYPLYFPKIRFMTVLMVSRSGNNITLAQPLPSSFTSGATGATLELAFQVANTRGGFGLEDLRVDGTVAGTTLVAVGLGGLYGSWCKNVRTRGFINYGLRLYDMHGFEVRGCWTKGPGGVPTNNAGLLSNTCSYGLVEDNIFVDSFPAVEINQGAMSNIFSYNYCGAGIFTVNHGPWNSFNLYEGNQCWFFHSDGYFGGNSQDTFFRNRSSFVPIIKRFARQINWVGNISSDPSSDGYENTGLPNIGNGDSNGTAEPSTGDWWLDWDTGIENPTRLDATLTTRSTATTGVLTLGSGQGAILQASIDAGTGGSEVRFITFEANTEGGSLGGSFVVTDITGDVVTFTTWSGTQLPLVGEVGVIQPGPSGFQERDLDVENTLIKKVNYRAYLDEIPGDEDLGAGETIPNSYYLSGTPAFFIAASKEFPPFDPFDPTTNVSDRIPAEARYLAETPPEAPVFTSEVSITGNEREGSVLTSSGGVAIGIPEPTYTFQWQRDGMDIPGATLQFYTVTSLDVGSILTVIWTASNGEVPDATSEDSTGEIQPFVGDVLVVTQVENVQPVTELWLRGALTAGVSAPLEYYLVQHSGDYPTQPDNNFVYARFGTPQDNVYVFQGTISEAEAIASVP